MKQITLRDVGFELHNALKREASHRGLSMNRYILLVLRKATGLGDGQTRHGQDYHDLDHLAGTWKPEEFEQFQQQLISQRSLDEELWP